MRLYSSSWYVVIREVRDRTTKGTVVAGYVEKEQAENYRRLISSNLPNHFVWVIAREEY